MDCVRVFPGLEKPKGEVLVCITGGSIRKQEEGGKTYARKSAVVPEITLMRETVANVTEFTLLDILLDRVEEFILGDLP